MDRACSKRGSGAIGPGAGDAAGNRDHPPAPLREAELPVRGRRGAPRVGRLELLEREQNEVRHAPSRRGARGAPGDGALPGGEGAARDTRKRGSRGAGLATEPPGLSPAAEAASGFERSDALFRGLVGFLRAEGAGSLAHEELEVRLAADARDLTRQLLQDHLDLRAAREVRSDAVTDAEDVAHSAVEEGHHRPLETVFGEVTVTRLAYRAKGAENLHLQDATLNLPVERHSHGLRELAAIEATRGSYEEAQSAIERHCGVALGKRQVEGLVRRAAVDVIAFYEGSERPGADKLDALVISADGKGIVMRPDALRPATRKAAAIATHKLKTRLSKGEKRDRKRMAELAVVYDAAPVTRSAADILARGEDAPKAPGPVAKAKWLTASVVEDAKTVIMSAFDESERRDPDHLRPWVALVDGAVHQIEVITAEAKARGLTIHITCDFIHVLEYLWAAAWSFFDEGDPAAEAWVAEKGLAILEGKAGIVAGAIRRKATTLGLDPQRRKKADECASYLEHKRPYLDYPKALEQGWPIATGVIEGSCRYIVRDRFDITGARWSLDGAEAVLKLRAVRANGDWAAYWCHHLAKEKQRVHASRYADGIIPEAA